MTSEAVSVAQPFWCLKLSFSRRGLSSTFLKVHDFPCVWLLGLFKEVDSFGYKMTRCCTWNLLHWETTWFQNSVNYQELLSQLAIFTKTKVKKSMSICNVFGWTPWETWIESIYWDIWSFTTEVKRPIIALWASKRSAWTLNYEKFVKRLRNESART